MKVMT